MKLALTPPSDRSACAHPPELLFSTIFPNAVRDSLSSQTLLLQFFSSGPQSPPQLRFVRRAPGTARGFFRIALRVAGLVRGSYNPFQSR